MATLLTRDNTDERFLAWKAKKDEEHRIRLVEEKQKEIKRQEEIAQRREVGKLAYQRWLSARMEADKEITRERIRNRLSGDIGRQLEEKRREDARLHYQLWRERKDTELKYKVDHERAQKKIQPAIRGYCSVWCCDKGLAHTMLRKVKRPSSYSLGDFSSYEIF